MDWNDVDDILYDGTEEQIRAVRCPECGGELELSFCAETMSRETRCLGCQTEIRTHGSPYIPNYALTWIFTKHLDPNNPAAKNLAPALNAW